MDEPKEGNTAVIECVGVVEAMAATAAVAVRMRTNLSFHQRTHRRAGE